MFEVEPLIWLIIRIKLKFVLCLEYHIFRTSLMRMHLKRYTTRVHRSRQMPTHKRWKTAESLIKRCTTPVIIISNRKRAARSLYQMMMLLTFRLNRHIKDRNQRFRCHQSKRCWTIAELNFYSWRIAWLRVRVIFIEWAARLVTRAYRSNHLPFWVNSNNKWECASCLQENKKAAASTVTCNHKLTMSTILARWWTLKGCLDCRKQATRSNTSSIIIMLHLIQVRWSWNSTRTRISIMMMAKRKINGSRVRCRRWWKRQGMNLKTRIWIFKEAVNLRRKMWTNPGCLSCHRQTIRRACSKKGKLEMHCHENKSRIIVSILGSRPHVPRLLS